MTQALPSPGALCADFTAPAGRVRGHEQVDHRDPVSRFVLEAARGNSSAARPARGRTRCAGHSLPGDPPALPRPGPMAGRRGEALGVGNHGMSRTMRSGLASSNSLWLDGPHHRRTRPAWRRDPAAAQGLTWGGVARASPRAVAQCHGERRPCYAPARCFPQLRRFKARWASRSKRFPVTKPQQAGVDLSPPWPERKALQPAIARGAASSRVRGTSAPRGEGAGTARQPALVQPGRPAGPRPARRSPPRSDLHHQRLKLPAWVGQPISSSPDRRCGTDQGGGWPVRAAPRRARGRSR